MLDRQLLPVSLLTHEGVTVACGSAAVNHIATTAGIGKSAWFKDPDGNTIALFQPE